MEATEVLSSLLTSRARFGAAAWRRLTLAAPALAALGAAAAAAAEPPPNDFSWSPKPAIQGEPTIFRAVQDDRIVHYGWDLDGDSTYDDATGAEVPRTFQNARTYTVGLLTVTQENEIRQVRKSVTVVAPGTSPNDPPEASFVFFPAGPVAGEPITFVSTATDPDSPIPSSALQWDLNGDGAFDDAQGASVTTTFPVAGIYTIALRVTTSATDEAAAVLNVAPPGSVGTASGQRALPLLSPFPVVRIAGRTSRRGARIRRLTIDAPPGAIVKVRCSGRGCPFERLLRRISTRVTVGGGLPPTRLLRVRRLEGKLLRRGVTLRVFVMRDDAVGKFTRFRIRKGKPPARTDMCLVPGRGGPVLCPAR